MYFISSTSIYANLCINPSIHLFSCYIFPWLPKSPAPVFRPAESNPTPSSPRLLPGLVACTFWIPGWRPTGRRSPVWPRLRCRHRIPRFFRWVDPDYRKSSLGFWLLLDFLFLFKKSRFKEVPFQGTCVFWMTCLFWKSLVQNYGILKLLTTNHDLLIVSWWLRFGDLLFQESLITWNTMKGISTDNWM